MWTRIATVLCALFLPMALGAACQTPEVEGQEPEFQPIFGVSVGPDLLDFGTQEVGAVTQLELQLDNSGNVDAFIEDYTATSGDITVEVESPVVFAGSSTRLFVRWHTRRPALLEGKLRLKVDRGDGTIETLPVDLYGSGLGADAVLSVKEYDFGALALGCAEQLEVTLSNAGTQSLEIDEVRLQGGAEFTLRTDLDLPVTVPPFGGLQLSVQYRPADDLPDLAELHIVSDQGEAITRIRGTGFADRTETVSIKANPIRPVVVLVMVNEVASGRWLPDIQARFEDSLPVLFNELKDSKNPYRVAFVADSSGRLSVSPIYIDESMSVARSVSVAIDQTAISLTVGDNDRMYDTLTAALVDNDDWIFDSDWIGESSLGAEPRLVLVAINDDADQSPTTAGIAVGAMQSWVEDPANVKLHGISGPLAGFTCAVPNAKFKDGVDLTGGTYHDICGTDWDDYWRSIVRTSVPPSLGSGDVKIPLRGTPLVATIEVTLDGDSLDGGWRYAPDEASLVIDSRFALDGERLQITYQTSTACGG